MQQKRPDAEIIHLRAHEATIRVFRSAHDGLAAHVEARVHDEAATREILESREWGMRVRSALLELPAGFREILIAHYVQGRSIRALAEDRSEREDALESRLRRARSAFRDLLIEGAQSDE